MLWYKKFKNGFPGIREVNRTNVKYETATTHLENGERKFEKRERRKEKGEGRREKREGKIRQLEMQIAFWYCGDCAHQLKPMMMVFRANRQPLNRDAMP